MERGKSSLRTTGEIMSIRKVLSLVLALSTPVVAAPPSNISWQCSYMIEFLSDIPEMSKRGLAEDNYIIGWEGSETLSERQTWMTAKHMLFIGVPIEKVFEWCHGAHIDGHTDAWK